RDGLPGVEGTADEQPPTAARF
ncbi:MAG: hypothetical protein QOG40_1067, partial [Solirubrobacteraceae bacterium]|nr:hypothetical protein [Solirubrobacteraceae bacterium]